MSNSVKASPIEKPDDQRVALYILILAGLFGNRWNANKVPATSTSSLMIAPMGKNASYRD
jgi:hypothetical protein